jgi:hypothetical protein
MSEAPDNSLPSHGGRMRPAEPLWRLAPTRADDGSGMADFMMLIPGLAARSRMEREHVAGVVREVCAGYGDQVAFADINYRINVLWVSVAAVPGLAGRVAASIRQRVPDALLVGGQLGTPAALTPAAPRATRWWWRLRRVSRRLALRLETQEPPPG